MASAFKWIRVVAFFSLLVMTTAMAASPVREAVMPLLAQPFARWSGNFTPAGVPLATGDLARTETAGVVTGGRLTPLGSPDQFTVTSAASPSASITDADRFDYQGKGHGGAARVDGDGLTPDQLAMLAKQSGSRFDLGPWQPGGGSGSRAGSASLAPGGRGERGREKSDNKSVSGGNGSREDGSRAPGQGNGNGGSGGPTRQPAPPSVPSAPSTPGEASNVFTEYTNGLPVLTGGASGAAGGLATLSGTTVAANPEPSTLLLLGTGLAAAAGALRRRVARG